VAGRPLKFGIQLPVVETDRHDAPRWSEILHLARRVEDLGVDSVWVPDHLLFRRPGAVRPTHGVWEGWSLVAALAAATGRITIGTLVVCTAFRHPALLARMAATVDEISGGRFILGLGAGWHEPEFQAFGLPVDHRASRFEEALAIVHGLLRNGVGEFNGTFYRVRDASLGRGAPSPTGLPIMVGTTGPRMLRATARYADLWNTGLVTGRCGPEAVPPLREMVDAACADIGRAPATLGRTINPLVAFSLPGATPIPPGTEPVTGSPEDVAEAFRGFAREGICHLQLLLNPCNLAALDELAAVLAILDEDP
jgi:alkanesulfonate monooxygenase SsuD/methylene tetrahydromethanopterin reductase-like flavin-dependent oxidoreductase (luciferase family)